MGTGEGVDPQLRERQRSAAGVAGSPSGPSDNLFKANSTDVALDGMTTARADIDLTPVKDIKANNLAEQAQEFDDRRLRALRHKQALDAARSDLRSLTETSLNDAMAYTTSDAQVQLDLSNARQRGLELENMLAARVDKTADVVKAARMERDAARAVAARTKNLARAARQQVLDSQREQNIARQDQIHAAQVDSAALQTEREKVASLTRVLMSAWKERDTAQSRDTRTQEALRGAQKQNLDLTREHNDLKHDNEDLKHQNDVQSVSLEQAARTASTDRVTLQQGRFRASVLENSLTAAREELEALKLANAQLLALARPSLDDKPAKRETAARPRKSKAVKASARKPQQATGMLPASLLPTDEFLRN